MRAESDIAIETPLKSGATTTDSRLDCVEEKDPASRDFAVADITPQTHYQRPRSYTWRAGPTLDQGSQGACVGFAWAHELAARPAVVKDITADFARTKIYFEAQKLDRFPGGAWPGALPFQEGTSVLGGAKSVEALGFISEYRWAFDFWDLVASVGFRGPAVFGCKWSRKMNRPDKDGFVTPQGPFAGRHCILINAVKIVSTQRGDVSRHNSFFTFQNSWGPDWGLSGFGRLRFECILSLWDGAETCIPTIRFPQPRKPA